MSMHIDNVRMNLDGTMTVTLSADINPTVAASFAGAVVSGVATNPNPSQVDLVITVTPSVPVPRQVVTQDPGGSESIGGG